MLVRGQAPLSWSGEMPDVLAVLRGGYAPDGGGAGDGGSGDGQGAGGAGAGGGSGSGGTGSDGQPFDADRATALIAKLRDENKAALAKAKERDDLAARLQAIEDKDKSDGEKAVNALKTAEAKIKAAELEAESLRNRYTGALIGAAIEREAGKANAVDAETVAALVDRSAITIDEAGNVTGADKAVKALLTAKPFLVNAGTSGAGGVKSMPGTPPGAGNPSRDEQIKQKADALRGSGSYPGF